MSTTSPSPPPDDTTPRSRLDREIDEILERDENVRLLPPPPTPQPIRSVPKPAVTVPPIVHRLLGVPLFPAMALAILAYMIRDISPLVTSILCFLAVACIIWPSVQRVRQPRQTLQSQMWRGKIYEVPPPPQSTTSPLDPLRQWWNSRR